jgi:hypothetical protein
MTQTITALIVENDVCKKLKQVLEGCKPVKAINGIPIIYECGDAVINAAVARLSVSDYVIQLEEDHIAVWRRSEAPRRIDWAEASDFERLYAKDVIVCSDEKGISEEAIPADKIINTLRAYADTRVRFVVLTEPPEEEP